MRRSEIVILMYCVGISSTWNPWTPPASQCLLPTGKLAPCKPGNEVCNGANGPPGPFGRNTPQFHVRDGSCGINDPVSPVYDPVHGVYHLHYENHVGFLGGYTHGHAVSRDFVHWAHMPIDIWNDQPYDNQSIFTGSATVVDGQVIQVYPGLCDVRNADCPGGTNLCIAVPANSADPLQTHWSKSWVKNPIVNNTQRDPSTAWQTSHGEWRLTTYDTKIYGSMDFKSWYEIGPAPGFKFGECPSFFPLPKATASAGSTRTATTPTPTHVHKSSHDGADWMCVGTYDEGAIKSAGSFIATPGITAGLSERRIDQGAYYASKDFYDPVKNRRIIWGWAKVHPASTQSLPREITWHAELQQLVFSPVEEQDQLREKIIGRLEGATLNPNRRMTSMGLPKFQGNTSEILVSFDRPTRSVQLGVKVMVGTSSGYSKWENGFNSPGDDYEVNTSGAHVQNDDGYTGTLFTIDYEHDPANISTVNVQGGPYKDSLRLLPSDKSIDMHLYVDNTMTEAYWMGGRVAMTVDTPATEDADVVVSVDEKSVANVVFNATVWSVSPIWVTPSEVLRTARLDKKHLEVTSYFV